MAKSNLTEDQWLALFAEELAGVPRRALIVEYGVSKSAINVQAMKRGLRKRDTGAVDHRLRPPGGWPEHQPLPQNRLGMTPGMWRAAAQRRLDGEDDKVIAADLGVSTGALHNQAAGFGMLKRDVPGAVYRSHARRDTAAPDPFDTPDEDALAAPPRRHHHPAPHPRPRPPPRRGDLRPHPRPDGRQRGAPLPGLPRQPSRPLRRHPPRRPGAGRQGRRARRRPVHRRDDAEGADTAR